MLGRLANIALYEIVRERTRVDIVNSSCCGVVVVDVDKKFVACR